MHIVVGSKKTYKVEAARSACELVFPNEVVRVDGIVAESGVSDQPMSNTESIAGATNRAKAAIRQASQVVDYAVGIENGLVEVDDQWFATTWIVVINSAGEEGIASSLHRPVPRAIMLLVEQGQELSEAIRNVWGESGESGFIGLLSGDVLRKQEVLRDGIITAFSPFLIHGSFERK